MIGFSYELKTRVFYDKFEMDKWLNNTDFHIIDIKFAVNPDTISKTYFLVIYKY